MRSEARPLNAAHRHAICAFAALKHHRRHCYIAVLFTNTMAEGTTNVVVTVPSPAPTPPSRLVSSRTSLTVTVTMKVRVPGVIGHGGGGGGIPGAHLMHPVLAALFTYRTRPRTASYTCLDAEPVKTSVPVSLFQACLTGKGGGVSSVEIGSVMINWSSPLWYPPLMDTLADVTFWPSWSSPPSALLDGYVRLLLPSVAMTYWSGYRGWKSPAGTVPSRGEGAEHSGLPAYIKG